MIWCGINGIEKAVRECKLNSAICECGTRASAAPVAPTPESDWREPHPPSRHCMCPYCIPSFDGRFAAPQAPEPVGAVTKRVNLQTGESHTGPELYERYRDLPPRTLLYAAPVQPRERTESEREILSTYAKLHDGKVGAHWLWVVIEQIAAGIPEDQAMSEFGYYEKRTPSEVIGWATHHEPPMLFPTREEAVLHCDDDERPRALVEMKERAK